MRKKQMQILQEYIYNQRCFIEKDIAQLQFNVLRHSFVSPVDCLELIIAQERLNTFNEITKDIVHILKIEEKHENKPP